ncbi:hypothetical protein ABXT08_20935, partial [Chryseobacterium sp. NRRL B-14859]|uniref:hypothetical protein n=1 Tax=Chryseobacterium sp. NRRL B-14859 TaxID=1562763 RepID=UPI003391F470
MQNFNLFISAIEEDNEFEIENYKKEFLNNPDTFLTDMSIFIDVNLEDSDKLQYIIDLYNIFDTSEQMLS